LLSALNQRFLYIRRRYNRWSALAIVLVALIGIPIFTILLTLLEGPGPHWQHISQTVLPDYILNSLLLVLGVGLLSLLLGISSAWLVSTCEFPGRRFFQWALILPLALPTYIIAYVYAGLTSYTGPLQSLLRNTFGFSAAEASIDIMNIWGVIFVMSLVLYPYVYVISRTSFLSQSRTLLESSRILGSGSWTTFFRIALPVSRPAFIGGLMLVLMEVLNDYGAVKYYGISTFTTGIFRAWFSLGDANAAIYLSALLMLFIFGLIALERWQRGKARYDSGESTPKPLRPYVLGKGQASLAFLVCSIPFLFGFLVPLLQLLSWAYQTAGKVIDARFFTLIVNSFTLAALAAAICVLVSVLLIFAALINKARLVRGLSKVAMLGYSIPGAVIAVGIMIPLIALDKELIGFMQQSFSYSGGLLLSGSIVGLVFAYMVRFLAVSFNPIEAGTKKISPFLVEAARSMGMTPLKALIKVKFPLLKNALLSASLLVFVDVLKELPLTLILRPFNYHTLATKAYELAGDELIAESANAALIVIATGILPILFLNRLITSPKNRQGAGAE
jgi:iron(III) transport system permease protein